MLSPPQDEVFYRARNKGLLRDARSDSCRMDLSIEIRSGVANDGM